jgi:hypothetical protein
MLTDINKYSKCLVDDNKNIIFFNKEWQYPAVTEWSSYISVAESNGIGNNAIYIGYPWATLIDGIRNHKKNIEYLIIELNFLKELIASKRKNAIVVTVCQHILLKEFIEYFKIIGIDIIFWSHKVVNQEHIDSIIIKPFPLYPAQTKDHYEKLISIDIYEYEKILIEKKIKYKANFIGAYNPKVYISDVRQHIFNDKSNSDFLIIERKEWHFEQIVYSKQIGNTTQKHQDLFEEEKRKKEYIKAIEESDFTLCPTGSGPNSIRIYESLCLGSIPVILSEDLDLPGQKQLWIDSCIITKDSKSGYEEVKKIISNMSAKEILQKKLNGFRLISSVGYKNYSKLIRDCIAIKELGEIRNDK